jgi:transposase
MVIDGRKMKRDAQEMVRKLAVRRVREGERPSEVIKSFGLCRTTIYKWLEAEEKRGHSALDSRKASGRPCKLAAKQKRKVRKWITGKDPRQYGFDFGLWTRKILAALIEEKFGVELGLTAVGRLLAELDVTPQKPLRRAYERDPETVKRWKHEEFPEIKRRAKKRKAELFFLDESGVRSDTPLGRTWAPKGKTPVVKTSGQRQSINAISAVNPRGAFWYDVFTGTMNATVFLELLMRFMRRRRKPVILVIDRHPAHIAKMIARFVQSQEGRLEIFFLPGYAPDLNPDEFVWNHIKRNGVSKKPLKKNESLRQRVQRDLTTIKKDPSLVRSFFRPKTVAYIMD